MKGAYARLPPDWFQKMNTMQSNVIRASEFQISQKTNGAANEEQVSFLIISLFQTLQRNIFLKENVFLNSIYHSRKSRSDMKVVVEDAVQESGRF